MAKKETPDSDGRAPSNTELAERTARIEQKIDGVNETLARIEKNLTEEQDALAADLEQNADKTRKMWAAYRLAKYGVPTTATVLGTAAAVGLI